MFWCELSTCSVWGDECSLINMKGLFAVWYARLRISGALSGGQGGRTSLSQTIQTEQFSHWYQRTWVASVFTVEFVAFVFPTIDRLGNLITSLGLTCYHMLVTGSSDEPLTLLSRYLYGLVFLLHLLRYSPSLRLVVALVGLSLFYLLLLAYFPLFSSSPCWAPRYAGMFLRDWRPCLAQLLIF